MKEEFSAGAVVDYHVELVFALEGIFEVHDHWMLNLLKDSSFSLCPLHFLLRSYPLLLYNLHCIYFIIRILLH